MKLIKLMTIFCGLLLLAACKPQNEDEILIDWVSCYPNLDLADGEALLKITSDEDLAKYFGEAIVETSKPEEVNFDKEFIIAKILPKSKLGCEMCNPSVKIVGDNKIELIYDLIESPDSVHKGRPILTIAVPSTYKDYELKDATNGIVVEK